MSRLEPWWQFGKSRGTPLNRLIDDMTTAMLAEFDAETRFRLRVAQGAGKTEQGLALLDKLDANFANVDHKWRLKMGNLDLMQN